MTESVAGMLVRPHDRPEPPAETFRPFRGSPCECTVSGMTEPFEAFVRRFQDMVFATAVRLLGDASEAEDAAQTVFLRAFQHYAQLASNPAAAGWLKTTTRNVCLNHLTRYRSRRRAQG